MGEFLRIRSWGFSAPPLKPLDVIDEGKAVDNTVPVATKKRVCARCLKRYRMSKAGKMAKMMKNVNPNAQWGKHRWPDSVYFVGSGRNCIPCREAEQQSRDKRAKEKAALAILTAQGKAAPSPKRALRMQKPPSRSNNGWWTLYNHYLNSPLWNQFRASVLSSRGRKCERCDSTDGVMHIHHLTYERVGQEQPADVVVLCVPCHEKAHGRKLI